MTRRERARWTFAMAAILTTTLGCTCGRPELDVAEVPFLEDRATFQTQLDVHGPSPQPGEPIVPTDDLEVIEYVSAERTLRGWMRWPHDNTEERVPLLVYLHGGFALGRSDLDDCAAFTDAGYAVYSPALRGENGNPGDHELFLGELDDACAAIQQVSAHPRVDPTRVVVFGHSAGGMLAAMVALRDDTPVVDTGSAGGMYDASIFDAFDIPFHDTPRERRVRLFAPYLQDLRQPHFACAGDDDGAASVLEALLERAHGLDVPFEGRVVPGDHFTSLPTCMQMYLARVEARFLWPTAR